MCIYWSEKPLLTKSARFTQQDTLMHWYNTTQCSSRKFYTNFYFKMKASETLKPLVLQLLKEYNEFNHKSAKTWYVLESTEMSRMAEIVAARDIMAKKPILNRCQSFCELFSLSFFALRYMWFARINVRGNVLIAPVRLMKSPRNGRKAATNVLKAR